MSPVFKVETYDRESWRVSSAIQLSLCQPAAFSVRLKYQRIIATSCYFVWLRTNWAVRTNLWGNNRTTPLDFHKSSQQNSLFSPHTITQMPSCGKELKSSPPWRIASHLGTPWYWSWYLLPTWSKNSCQPLQTLPVLLHKAVVEVSKIGHNRRGELVRRMDGKANPLTDGKVVAVSGYLSICLSVCLSFYLSA